MSQWISSAPFYIVLGVIFTILLLAVFVFLPTETRKAKRKKNLEAEVKPQKDWQEAALRLEKHILSLRQEIMQYKVEVKRKEKELVDAKTEIKRLIEKIQQERGWLNKEQQDVEKTHRETQDLKNELAKSEESLEKEHTQRLNLEFELKESKASITALNELRLKLESEIAQRKGQQETLLKENRAVKEENAKLSQKHAETDWIAKTEYDKLEKILKQKEIELEKLKRDLQREIL